MKSGLITIVGRPNAGKSTLTNTLCGSKVAIVSNKPQTTRNRISAVTCFDGVQLVLMDTPGFHKPKNKLDDAMQRTVNESMSEVDAIVLVVEPIARIGKPESILLERIDRQTPCILVINKVDKLPRHEILPVIKLYNEQMDFAAIIPLSAKTGEGVNLLKHELAKLMPEGPQLFPDGMITDQPDQIYACELVREKLLWALNQEIPHGIACVCERWGESPGLLSIGVTIVCERDSHKSIVIGKHGAVLKKVGEQARVELEKFFGCKVFLETWVKVRKNWRDSQAHVRSYGYMTDG